MDFSPSALTPLILVLVGSCFLLGASGSRHWRHQESGRLSGQRRAVAGLGWSLLLLSALGMTVQLGAEVGLAWLVLVLGLSALGATIWLSYWPSRAPWIGVGCCAAALLAWVLG